MALGNDRPRNWGRDSQTAALNLLLHDRKAAFKLVPHKHNKKRFDLMVAPSNGKITLAFTTIATVEHLGRLNWLSEDPVTGDAITSAGTQKDLVRKTIEQRWV